MIEDRQQILNAVFVLKNEGLFQASRRVEMLKKGATAGLWFDLIFVDFRKCCCDCLIKSVLWYQVLLWLLFKSVLWYQVLLWLFN